MKNGNATKRHAVIFDGECGFCTASVNGLKKLDWFHKFEFVSLREPRALQIAKGITKEEFEKAVYCVSKNGKTTSAARCFRFIGLRTPLLFPLALLLWIPGMLWIAEKVYRGVAQNRTMLSGLFGLQNTKRD